MDFNLNSDENLYLIPPYLNAGKELYLQTWEKLNLKKHVFIFSSGTTSVGKKSYALSKEALFENAKAVNTFLKSTKGETWFNTLPYYHVGGLSIYFRSHLLGSQVIEYSAQKWQAESFIAQLNATQPTYTSLVPTQVLDIVKSNFRAPSGLKGVFVGGDFLAPNLALKFYELGWPLIITYGMTEVSSQIASTYYNRDYNDYMQLLDIHKIKGNQLISPSLYSAEIIFNDDIKIKRVLYNKIELLDEIDLYEDSGVTWVKPLGRIDGAIKIKERLFYANDLKKIFHHIFMELNLLGRAEVFIEGKNIEVYLKNSDQNMRSEILNAACCQLPPIKDFINFRLLDKLDKTNLGKIKKIE